MVKTRGRDRRTRDAGPPMNSQERRYLGERRKKTSVESSLHQFEALMSALGFRNHNDRGA